MLGSHIHAECACAAAEAIALGSVLPAVALSAEDLVLVRGGVGAVQSLVAHVCRDWGRERKQGAERLTTKPHVSARERDKSNCTQI